ncbi:MAG: hypothetical protein ACRCZ0_10770 [Cetobacterium sp.]
MPNIYARGYIGRKYYFKVIEREGRVLYIENMETFSKSKLSLDFLYCKDEYIRIGDLIERQYTRGGMSIYNRGGLDISEGSTTWVNVTSEERYNKKNPITSRLDRFFRGTFVTMFILSIFFPPILYLWLIIALITVPVYLVLKLTK